MPSSIAQRHSRACFSAVQGGRVQAGPGRCGRLQSTARRVQADSRHHAGGTCPSADTMLVPWQHFLCQTCWASCRACYSWSVERIDAGRCSGPVKAKKLKRFTLVIWQQDAPRLSACQPFCMHLCSIRTSTPVRTCKPMQVDPAVSAAVWLARSAYFSHVKDFAEFYKSSLMYLAFVSSKDLEPDYRLVGAHTCIAALHSRQLPLSQSTLLSCGAAMQLLYTGVGCHVWIAQ